MSTSEFCPFCSRDDKRILGASDTALAFPDQFPISRGHALVVPRRHVASLFDLTAAEQEDIWRLVATVRLHLLDTLAPAGFNVGLNDGAAAGQTVGHAHVHLIPRYAGDVADPRGGVRWVLPAQADYWNQPSPR